MDVGVSELVKNGIPDNKSTPIYADRENLTERGKWALDGNGGLILERVIISSRDVPRH